MEITTAVFAGDFNRLISGESTSKVYVRMLEYLGFVINVETRIGGSVTHSFVEASGIKWPSIVCDREDR